LYQAGAHGCNAGLHQHVFDNVYYPRISRGSSFYSTDVLGAISSDLALLSHFFSEQTQAWTKPIPKLSLVSKGWVLNEIGFTLLSVSRPVEAAFPLELSIENAVKVNNFAEASRRAGNLFLLRITCGELDKAIQSSSQALQFASKDNFPHFVAAGRIAQAVVLTYSGKNSDGLRELEQALSTTRRSDIDLMYLYGNVLLSAVERWAWLQTMPNMAFSTQLFSQINRSALMRLCEQTIAQTKASLEGGGIHHALLGSSMELLHSCRAKAFYALLSPAANMNKSGLFADLRADVDKAVTGLRQANREHFLPEGLLTRAWLRGLTATTTELEYARNDLDEAWRIAKRGSMRLFLADIQLNRARLFFRQSTYPWESPLADLAAAEKLINECGYHRRDQELADAKRVILGKVT
jgi:hypothetical protein